MIRLIQWFQRQPQRLLAVRHKITERDAARVLRACKEDARLADAVCRVGAACNVPPYDVLHRILSWPKDDK